MENIGSPPSQTFSTNSFFTPLLISIMGIGATALTILIYHMLVVRYCMRRQAARMASLQAFAGPGIPTGVDEKTLLTIPISTYSRTGTVDSDQCECAVCLGDIENGDEVRLLPNCKHVFHVTCIDEWFVAHTSCPVCRVPVVAPDGDIQNCPVCRSSVETVPVSGTVLTDDICHYDDDDDDDDQNDCDPVDGLELVTRPRMLRHCNSLVLPRKVGFSGMELKRSLSMGQTRIDIRIENVDRDCSYYCSIRDQSIRQFQRVSSRVRQSFSRMRVRQGSGILLPY